VVERLRLEVGKVVIERERVGILNELRVEE